MFVQLHHQIQNTRNHASLTLTHAVVGSLCLILRSFDFFLVYCELHTASSLNLLSSLCRRCSLFIWGTGGLLPGQPLHQILFFLRLLYLRLVYSLTSGVSILRQVLSQRKQFPFLFDFLVFLGFLHTPSVAFGCCRVERCILLCCTYLDTWCVFVYSRRNVLNRVEDSIVRFPLSFSSCLSPFYSSSIVAVNMLFLVASCLCDFLPSVVGTVAFRETQRIVER